MSQSLFWNLFAKKLNGEASPDELLMLDNLVRENPGLVYQAEQIEHVWNKKACTDPYESELAFELLLNHLKEKGIDLQNPESTLIRQPVSSISIKRSRLRKWMVPAVLSIFLLITALVWKESTQSSPRGQKNYGEISTRPGSKTKLVLPDSTVVWLNAGSKLTYGEDFGISNRNTTLVGEAFFDVKRNSVPFIIHAGAVQIRVLGTAFNVKAYPNERTTETSVLRGKVEVTLNKRPDEPFVLRPDEKLIVSNAAEKRKAVVSEKKEPIAVLGSITRSDDSTILETSWVQNKLIFNDESFADVAKKMERWYDVKITFKDEEVANYHLHGSFTTETIHEALDALRIGSRFSYKIEGQNITIAK